MGSVNSSETAVAQFAFDSESGQKRRRSSRFLRDAFRGGLKLTNAKCGFDTFVHFPTQTVRYGSKVRLDLSSALCTVAQKSFRVSGGVQKGSTLLRLKPGARGRD